MVAVVEELGTALLPEPLVPVAVLSAGSLIYGDNDTLKHQLLPGICTGTIIPAVAWQESPHQITAGPSTTRADKAGSGFILHGFKNFVQPLTSDGYVVSAASVDGLGLFWIPSGSAGLIASTSTSADGTKAASLKLEGVCVAPEHVVATPGSGELALSSALENTSVAASAELLGLMKGAFALTLDHLKNRAQFGKPVGAFQALQHRAVDLFIQIELANAAVTDAAEAFDTGAPLQARAVLASRVKARCSDAALLITREAIQMHGAIGFTEEHDIGLYLNRALSLAPWIGSGAAHRTRFAALTAMEQFSTGVSRG